jgi:hypothetical protein
MNLKTAISTLNELIGRKVEVAFGGASTRVRLFRVESINFHAVPDLRCALTHSAVAGTVQPLWSGVAGISKEPRYTQAAAEVDRATEQQMVDALAGVDFQR